MTENFSRLQYLLHQYAGGNCSRVEETELFSLLNNAESNEAAFVLTEILEQTSPMPDKERRERLLKNIFNPLLQKSSGGPSKPGKIRTFTWQRIAVAATVILMISALSYFFLGVNTVKNNDVAKNTIVTHDVKAPVVNRAMISFANGQKIYLDSTANGPLMKQAGVDIIKITDGKIAYQGVTTELVYNTLTNPRGSKTIDMTLADGSRMWLNAGSSVTYPIAFIDNKRQVSITGEAYFEVAHNAAKPFIVTKDGMNIEVLGTHFNVNAYDEEADTKVTLMEGSVKVYNEKSTLLIKPGEQADVNKNGTLFLNKKIDMDGIMAWKNGRFIFNNADIESVMRQVSNWYDVEVVYEGKISKETFSGVLNRNGNLTQIIPLLKEGGVKCKIEGKKLTVSE
jgi:transmembrane sensor